MPKKQVLFTLMLPGPYDKLPDQFQEGIEGLQAQYPDMEVTQKVDFEPTDKDGNDFLMSAAWKGDERTLQVEPDAIIKERRWDMAQRVVIYREQKFWAQEKRLGSMEEYVAWLREQRERLGSLEVRFMGLVTPRPEDKVS